MFGGRWVGLGGRLGNLNSLTQKYLIHVSCVSELFAMCWGFSGVKTKLCGSPLAANIQKRKTIG
jgi:hypothetical protein